MREIKFRAWDTDEKIMEYDYEDSELIIEYGFHNKRYTPMQYTGLKDKNGKEIYEGDIVSLDSWEPRNHQIKFIEGAFCLANSKGEYSGDIFYIHHAGRSQGEIIGNIYENPELLK